MTLEEYKQRLSVLKQEAEKARLVLAKEYALSNNKVKIGDIITDHIGSIIVKKIFIEHALLTGPSCFYEGIELLKTGLPNKKNKLRAVWQSNIKNISPQSLDTNTQN